MIYRHLRQMESDGLVISEWDTEGGGPAKRMYTITEEGQEALSLWVDYMENKSRKLSNFIETYQKSISDQCD